MPTGEKNLILDASKYSISFLVSYLSPVVVPNALNSDNMVYRYIHSELCYDEQRGIYARLLISKLQDNCSSL